MGKDLKLTPSPPLIKIEEREKNFLCGDLRRL